MKSVLRIYNVSEYVHAGAAPKKATSVFDRKAQYYNGGVRELPDGSWSSASLPSGGLSFSLNPIFERITATEVLSGEVEEILIFCIDATPTIKRDMYKDTLKENGYKITRGAKSISVSIQREAIRDVLSLVSYNVMFCEGYEADDIIASLVWKYKNDYDHIYIHTRDSDLYCLVEDKVSIETVGLQGKTVNMSNFSKVLTDNNKYPLHYNGVLLNKLYYGDTSDNIPGVGKQYMEKIESVITKDKYKYLTNVRVLRSFVDQAVQGDSIVMGILDILIPLQVPDEILTIYNEPINIDRLYYLGNLVKNKYCKKDLSTGDEIVEVKQILDYYTEEYIMRGGS